MASSPYRRNTAVSDWPLVAVALLLSALGVALVYSAGVTDVLTPATGLWRQQLAWLTIGVCAAYVVSRSSSRLIDVATTPAYLLTLVLLAALFVIGSGGGTAASTKSWLTLGGMRIGQPSELAKIAVVLMLAKVLASKRIAAQSLFDLWRPALIVAIPWAMILLAKDLGTSMVLIGIFFAMLYWSGVSWSLLFFVASPGVSLILAFSTGIWGAWFLLVLAMIWAVRPKPIEGVLLALANVATGVVAPMLWNQLAEYQQKRLLVFLDPQSDPSASGYHLLQSQVAIGSGGWIGKGFTEGSQKRLAFLPAQHTDFIFSVLAEELGFIGVSVALILLCVLLLRVVRVATRAESPFMGLVAFGLAAGWLVHILVNIGMTVGLMPITGIPLPFFSYGGSFMLSCWIAIGILVRISADGRGRADWFVL
jgi:rod shape determining protein RodA